MEEGCETTRCDLNIHSKYKYCMTSQLCRESARSPDVLPRHKDSGGHGGFFLPQKWEILLLGQMTQPTMINCPGRTPPSLSGCDMVYKAVTFMTSIWLHTPSHISEDFLEMASTGISLQGSKKYLSISLLGPF